MVSSLSKLDDGSELQAETVMFATGRVPNVRGLGLQDAGVHALPGGMIPVNEYSQTNLKNVFAVGDVTNRVNLTPVALMEGHAFADSEFGGKPRPVNHRFIPSAVFSHPPVATVGFTEKDAAVHYGKLDVYKSVFTPMKHTLSGRKEKTMMKLLVQASSGKVVGLHVVGMDAPEIVQGFAVAIKSGLTKQQFDLTIGYTPDRGRGTGDHAGTGAGMKEKVMDARLKVFSTVLFLSVLMVLSLVAPVFAKSTSEPGAPGDKQRYIVILDDLPLAAYDGRIIHTPERNTDSTRLPATANRFTGARKLDVNSPASKKYLKFLDERFESFRGESALRLGRQLKPTHRYRNACEWLRNRAKRGGSPRPARCARGSVCSTRRDS